MELEERFALATDLRITLAFWLKRGLKDSVEDLRTALNKIMDEHNLV